MPPAAAGAAEGPSTAAGLAEMTTRRHAGRRASRRRHREPLFCSFSFSFVVLSFRPAPDRAQATPRAGPVGPRGGLRERRGAPRRGRGEGAAGRDGRRGSRDCRGRSGSGSKRRQQLCSFDNDRPAPSLRKKNSTSSSLHLFFSSKTSSPSIAHFLSPSCPVQKKTITNRSSTTA
mgnify:CR=1 FL=1